jgi:cobalt-zinc-cadmium efflux system membrane fusion protein
MKPFFSLVGVAVASVAVTYFLLRPTSQAAITPAATVPAVSRTTLQLAANAPQWAYLQVRPAEASAVPLLEPLHATIAYDDDKTALVFSPIAGRATRIVAQVGQSVRAGQVLMWMNSPDYAQAVADEQKAQSDLHLKQQALTRETSLSDNGVVARKDLESAQADVEQAQAEFRRARRRLGNLAPGAGDGSEFALRAPISGVVMERQTNPGTEVRPDATTPLFVISDPTQLWALAELPEKSLGKAVRVSVDAYPDHPFAGRVSLIGSVVDPQTRRISVRCNVPNPGGQLRPAMYARVEPVADGPSLPYVPNSALITEGVHTYLFVEPHPGTLEKRPVTLAFQGQDASYIKTGVQAGDQVVVTGALLLSSELGGTE